MLSRVDPDLRAALEQSLPHDYADLAAERRRAAQRRRATVGVLAASASVQVTRHTVTGLPGEPPVDAYQYLPESTDSDRPALIWLHGGGHVMGDASQDDAFLRRLAAATGVSAFAVQYRLAPEHPFPSSLRDAQAVLGWVSAEHQALGIDPERIAVGGASSGGGLAAGLALYARDRERIRLRFQLLVYPMLDDRPSALPLGGDWSLPTWSPADNRFAWKAYLAGADPGPMPIEYGAPARATSLAGLPAAAVFVGDLDLFHNQDVDYARRLGAAQVPMDLHVYAGAYHGFNVAVPDAEISRRFDRDLAEVLSAGLRRVHRGPERGSPPNHGAPEREKEGGRVHR
jgi:acetyl esterase/lipase